MLQLCLLLLHIRSCIIEGTKLSVTFDGIACEKDHIEYEVAWGSKRSTIKLVNHLIHNHHAAYEANNEKKVNACTCTAVQNYEEPFY